MHSILPGRVQVLATISLLWAGLRVVVPMFDLSEEDDWLEEMLPRSRDRYHRDIHCTCYSHHPANSWKGATSKWAVRHEKSWLGISTLWVKYLSVIKDEPSFEEYSIPNLLVCNVWSEMHQISAWAIAFPVPSMGNTMHGLQSDSEKSSFPRSDDDEICVLLLLPLPSMRNRHSSYHFAHQLAPSLTHSASLDQRTTTTLFVLLSMCFLWRISLLKP